MRHRILFLIPLLLLFVVIAFSFASAQDDQCPPLVQAALVKTDELCADTGRNQACYGNLLIDATLREPVTFANIGDKTDLTVIESLKLSSLDLENEQWGVAMLRMQANLPDTLPGQNVTMLLFGDTQIQNLTGVEVQEPVTVNAGVNVRLIPTERGSIIGSLPQGAAAIATGQYTNSTGQHWIRLKYVSGTRITGWVAGAYVNGTLDALPVLTVAQDNLNPMQAFYFTTGIGESSCAEAPLDGIMVQSPKGAGRVSFIANGVAVSLGSTAFLQSNPDNGFKMSVIEGEAVVTVEEKSQFIPAGMQIEIPVNEEGIADAPPPLPEPYDDETLTILNEIVGEQLPEPVVEIAPPRELPTNTLIPTLQPTTLNLPTETPVFSGNTNDISPTPIMGTPTIIFATSTADMAPTTYLPSPSPDPKDATPTDTPTPSF